MISQFLLAFDILPSTLARRRRKPFDTRRRAAEISSSNRKASGKRLERATHNALQTGGGAGCSLISSAPI
jgi:hypothetical protein